MKSYYTIISRDEFIKLYRFGNIQVKNHILNDDKNLEDNLIELLKLSSFEYEESYLIVKLTDETINSISTLLTIQITYQLKLENIKSIYALSDKAVQFYKTKVNLKVNFQISPFKNILKKIDKFKELEDISQGIKVLNEQFYNIKKEEIEKQLGSEFINDFLKFDNYLNSDFKNFYLDLLSYKRENKFIKNDTSYIYDLMIITLLQERRPESIQKFKQGELKLKDSPSYKKLDKNEKETLFGNIEFIQKTDDEDIKKFITKVDINHLIIGTIFLNIKDLILVKNETYQEKILKIVDSFKGQYKDNLSISLYLIGLVFGYKNLYDSYYDFIELEIFKDSENDSVQVVEKEEDTKLKDKIKILEENNKILLDTSKKSEEKSINYKLQLEDFKKNDIYIRELEEKIKTFEENNSKKEIESSTEDLESNSVIDINILSKKEWMSLNKDSLYKILKAKNINYSDGEKKESLIERILAKSDINVNKPNNLFE